MKYFKTLVLNKTVDITIKISTKCVIYTLSEWMIYDVSNI